MKKLRLLGKAMFVQSLLQSCFLLGSLLILWTHEAEATHIIARANLDGTQIESLVTVPSLTWGIALDANNGKIYWTELNDGIIRRANLNGSGVETLVTGNPFFPSAIALDTDAGKMYWTADTGDAKIQRANLDGTNIQDVVTTTSEIQRIGLALDNVNDKMYWTYGEIFLNQPPDKIQRSNLDGTLIEDLINTGRSPGGIALDVNGGQMYWTEVTGNGGAILRANLDGSGYEDLLTGLGDPFGIALDMNVGKMYWTNAGSGMIRRANLDGSGIEDLITNLDDQLIDPRAIALDLQGGKMYFTAWDTLITTIPLPPALWLFGSGLLGLIGIARRKKAA